MPGAARGLGGGQVAVEIWARGRRRADPQADKRRVTHANDRPSNRVGGRHVVAMRQGQRHHRHSIVDAPHLAAHHRADRIDGRVAVGSADEGIARRKAARREHSEGMEHLADIDDDSRIARESEPGLSEIHVGVVLRKRLRVPAFNLALREQKQSAPRLDRAPGLHAKHRPRIPIVSRQQSRSPVGGPPFDVGDALGEDAALGAGGSHRQCDGQGDRRRAPGG